MSTTDTPPNAAVVLAVIADELVQQQRLRALLVEAGYCVVICTSPRNLGHYQQAAPPIDLWVVDADLDACPESQRDWLLDSASDRLLFNEGPDCPRDAPDFAPWARRLLSTVERYLHNQSTPPADEATGSVPLVSDRLAMPAEPLLVDAPKALPPVKPALALTQALQAYTASGAAGGQHPDLWILAASLGGPVAVKQFLDALPANLPCTFIYAQHIDAEFEAQLARTIGRHSALPLTVMQHNDRLQAGHVYIAPIRHSIHFTHGGQIKLHNQPWYGPYNPSLDELMTTAATQYPGRVHCMVFSGMAGDAQKGSVEVRLQGGEVWVQSRDSCIQSAMPRLIKEAGQPTAEDDPRGLAQCLIDYLTAQITGEPTAADKTLSNTTLSNTSLADKKTADHADTVVTDMAARQ